MFRKLEWGQPKDQVNLCWGTNGEITPLKAPVIYISPGDGVLDLGISPSHESKQG